jgi:hypothetical protein
MLAKPAAMAPPPSTRSPTSWNPAVPPPPVCGAVLGYWVAEVLGGAAVLALEVGALLPVAVAGGVVLEVAGVLAVDDVLEVGGVLVLAELLAVDPSLAEPEDDVVGLPDSEQADSATATSTVISPQPTAARPALRGVRPMAVRACMKPPEVPDNDHHFHIAADRNRPREGKRVARQTFGSLGLRTRPSERALWPVGAFGCRRP